MRNTIILFLALTLLIGCQQNNTVTPPDGNATIVIIDQTFTPTEISATAGQILFFYNQDGITHRILSQSANNTFDDTQNFDSGIITDDSFGVITVPESAITGDVFYFYDDVLRSTMITPNGTITVE